MPDEGAKEGIDLDAAYQDQKSGDAEAEKAGDNESAEAETSDGDEEKAASDSDGDDEDGLGDLMDIFSDESETAESDAGLLDEFLEDLTMDQVSEEADRLLEEFRAI
ncbi:MAG: hypothetical protein IIB28_00725 [Chloroflexi bacterium]|nr:hypothetical protein [Chloroflexota bacterium]MCH8101658.1 hypothetical protein [Chloroflexota bacterium]